MDAGPEITPDADPSVVNQAIVSEVTDGDRVLIESSAIAQTDNGQHDDDPVDQPEQGTEVEA